MNDSRLDKSIVNCENPNLVGDRYLFVEGLHVENKRSPHELLNSMSHPFGSAPQLLLGQHLTNVAWVNPLHWKARLRT